MLVIFINKIKYFTTQLPKFLIYYIWDKILYIKNKEWRQFKGFGLHIYVGLFGAGKTTAMVKDAYCLACRYKDMNILTNLELTNFPKHTKISKLVHYKQIVDCEPNTLILIDEISSIFNSRDWKKGGIPATLLSHLLQVRKQRKMMFATAQRWKHVDKLIRDITFSVRQCKTICKRWTWVHYFDAIDVEEENAMKPAIPTDISAFIMTNKIRNLFNTDELIEKLNKSEYLSDAEILEKQGISDGMTVVNNGKKLKKKRVR